MFKSFNKFILLKSVNSHRFPCIQLKKINFKQLFFKICVFPLFGLFTNSHHLTIYINFLMLFITINIKVCKKQKAAFHGFFCLLLMEHLSLLCISNMQRLIASICLSILSRKKQCSGQILCQHHHSLLHSFVKKNQVERAKRIVLNDILKPGILYSLRSFSGNFL